LSCAGLGRSESCDSDHETASPVLAGKPTHGRQRSYASASRDSGLSGLTMSNPQLYDDALSPTDDQSTLEFDRSARTADHAAGTTGRNVTATTQTDSIPPRNLYQKSIAISDDSVLGSPDDFSTENSEHDGDDVSSTLRRRHASVDTATNRLATEFYAQRPNSIDVDTEQGLDDFAPSFGVSILGEQSLEREVMQSLSKSDGTRRSLERQNPVEDLTPVNSLRHKQRSMDREDGLFQDRIRRSPVAGIIAFRSGSATTAPVGCDVVENDRRLSGRRSADAISDRQPSAYEEALNRELLRDDLSEADRKQVKYSLARVKYHKSLVMYASAKSLERQSSRSPEGRFSESPSKMFPPKAVLSCEVLNRSSPVASVPRRNFSPSTTDVASRGSPHSRISPHTERYSPARSRFSPQEERYSPARSGGLTVTVSPANRHHDVARETHQPMWKSTSGESLLVEGRRRFQKKHRTVVDISSSGSDRSVSPHQNSRRGGSKRRAVRRRASDRHRHRYSDPKVDGGDVASNLAVNGAVNLGRSRSDASDVVSRVSDRYRSDRSVPRANESVNLLVTTSSSLERPTLLNNSDALSVSSDSTFTGNDAKPERRRMTAINERLNETATRAHTMKDRPWHRELVMQYLDPPTQYSVRPNTTTSRYVTRPRGAATVVYLPPLPRSRDISSGASRGGSTNTDLHKPTNSSRPLHTSSSYHSALPDLRSRDSSYPRSGLADATRRNGSGDVTRFPYSLVTSGSSDGRSGRRPSVPVAVECAKPRSAAHKPRPAIETRRPLNAVSDLPNINWSVSKLRERYGGGGGGSPGTSTGSQKSSVTTVTVDKAESSKPITSRIGAVQRLL